MAKIPSPVYGAAVSIGSVAFSPSIAFLKRGGIEYYRRLRSSSERERRRLGFMKKGINQCPRFWRRQFSRRPTVKIDGVEMGNDGRLRLRSVEKGKNVF